MTMHFGGRYRIARNPCSFRTDRTCTYEVMFILDTQKDITVWTFGSYRLGTTSPKSCAAKTRQMAEIMCHILNTPGIPERLLGPFAVWQVAEALWSKEPVAGAVSAAPVLWDYCIEHGIITPK